MKFTQASIAVSALAVPVLGHMKMANPAPFGAASLNNFPLLPDGSDFPCKAPGGVYPEGKATSWKAGDSQTISFIGSAVHGGGSCQFSVTKDKKPTKESEWRVIHSVIGGCPSDAPGNLPENAAGTDAGKFQVTMPKDIADGEYVFAWTWFNRIANREMYMNCAPISVSGGGSGDDFLQSLPNMAVANLPNGTCATVEMTDLDFANPGKSVEKGSAAKPGKLEDNGGCAKQAAMAGGSNPGSGGGSPGGNKPQPSTGAGYPAQPTPSKPAASNPGGVFAPGASDTPKPSAAPPAPSTVPQPSAAPQPPPTQATGAPAPPSGGDSGNGSTGGTPCSNDGGVVCIGSNQFGICNHGVAVAQELAAGMSCTDGKVVKRAAHPHFHRRHGSKLF